MKNYIDIILRTTSPWHVAYPDNESKKHKGRSLTQTVKIAGQAVPCFLGNGLRGRLRRVIGDLVIDAMSPVQGPIPVPVYTGLMTGSASAQPDSSPNSVEELLRSKEHVYMGLFGGGARTLASRYSVSDILPILAHTANAGAIPLEKDVLNHIVNGQSYNNGDKVETLTPYNLLDVRSFTKVDNITRGQNMSKVVENVENGAQGVADYITANSASDKARKADGSGATKKTSVSNMLSVECIAAGAVMHFRVEFAPDITPAQAGAILIGLESIFQKNYLGGWGRVGMGKYEVQSIGIRLDAFDTKETIEDNLYQDGDFTWNAASSSLKDFISQAQEEITAVSKDEMIGYFTNLDAKKK